jgi:hypothetical protein
MRSAPPPCNLNDLPPYKRNLRAKVPNLAPPTPQTEAMMRARYDVEFVILEVVRSRTVEPGHSAPAPLVDVRPSEQLRACRSNQKPVAEKYPEILTQQSENVYFSGRRPNARPRLGWRSRNLPPSSATNPLPPARKR